MITAAQIARDLELARKATPGPWKWCEGYDTPKNSIGPLESGLYGPGDESVIRGVWRNDGYADCKTTSVENGEFIVRARTALPEYAEALREAIGLLKDLHDHPHLMNKRVEDFLSAYHAQEKPE